MTMLRGLEKWVRVIGRLARVSLCLLCACGLMTTTAHAQLQSRLGGLAYYDTVLDITWMRDARAIMGTAWDDGSSNTDALVTWYSAMDWASQVTVSGIPGWRLPTQDVNGDGVVVECEFVSEAVCRDNQYGYMYFFNGITGENPGPFGGYLIPYGYWSSAEYVDYPEIIAWLFTFGIGQQHPLGKSYWRHAWAVRDGDIAAYKNGALAESPAGIAAYDGPTQIAYDSFDVAETTLVTGLDWYGTEHASGGYLQTEYRIYAGAPAMGALIASGTVVAERINTGTTTPQGEPIYEYSLRNLSIPLAAGSYYLGLAQHGLATATWLPSVGSPRPDDSYRESDGVLSGPLPGDQYFRVIGYGAPDADSDGIPDTMDNCLDRANPAQADKDGNGTGDACEPPRVSGIWPASAAVGDTVSLFVFGDYFEPGGTQVSVNGVALPLVQVVSAEMLIARAVIIADMFGPVSVATANGTAQGAGFGASLDGLQVSGTWPGTTTVEGRVFVFGSGFTSGTLQVRVGTTLVPLVHVLNDNLLIFVVPPEAVSAPVYVTTATEAASSPGDLNITL